MQSVHLTVMFIFKAELIDLSVRGPCQLARLDGHKAPRLKRTLEFFFADGLVV